VEENWVFGKNNSVLLLLEIKQGTDITSQTEICQREFGRNGVFALENMHSFAMKDTEAFRKVLLNSLRVVRFNRVLQK
jgi:hypothetical protein